MEKSQMTPMPELTEKTQTINEKSESTLSRHSSRNTHKLRALFTPMATKVAE